MTRAPRLLGKYQPTVEHARGKCSTCPAGRGGDEPVEVIRIKNVGETFIDLCIPCADLVVAEVSR